MIVPMKKVSIVALNSERLENLQKLKDAGVVHIEHLEGSSAKLTKFKENYSAMQSALGILGEVKLPKKAVQKAISAGGAKEVAESVNKHCLAVLDLTEQKKKLFEEITSDTLELERLEPWGDFDLDDYSYLESKGVSIRLFEIPLDLYSTIGEKLVTVKVNCAKKIVRFLLINGGDERPEGLPPEAYEVVLPALSTAAIKARIANNKEAIVAIEDKLREEALYKGAILSYKATLEDDIQFENVYSGMEREDAGLSTDLSWISGYIPIDGVKTLEEVAKKNSWALSLQDVADDDEGVPTKLRNNKLVSTIYPLTDFLGTVPGYHEYDISGWFLLFFTIFFGMIFGDGGYGLLVTVAALFMKMASAKSRKPNPMASLMLILGLATMAWGAVTCTWFGLTPEQLPPMLIKISVPQLSNAFKDVAWLPFWSNDVAKGVLTTDQNLQIFCFTLAFLQLSIAHLKGIGRYHKSAKCLGELGSLLQLWGMYYVVLSMVVSSTVFGFGEMIDLSQFISGAPLVPIGKVSIGLVAVGFALSFIFSNYDGSIGRSILESCKNIISVLLGVVNVFSDIVSYIRLWAVGLAGAAISSTVNQMAGPLLGRAILFVAFLLLVVFGHGLNMVLNLLSVIVHGVRLNTLEFSTHLGMSWSGFKYAPFSNRTK